MKPGNVTLLISGKIYGGWKTFRIARNIDHMASGAALTLTERWQGQADPWQIAPFTPCQVKIDDALVLTGYVDDYIPGYDANEHGVSIIARSKTEDIIDCTPDITGGQFSGYTLDRIARAIAAPFGINVVVQANVGGPYPDATIRRHESGFQFLERLARLRSVLLCDDENGNLVLTTAGNARANDALVQGRNILRARARLSGARRFSEYRVKTSAGVTTPLPFLNNINTPESSYERPTDSVADQHAAAASAAEASDAPQTPVVYQTSGIAYDKGVPRYRPHTIIAESGLDAKGAQERALWQAKYNWARGTSVQIDVQGFYQSNGDIWKINQVASVKSPFLQIDMELLIAGVSFEVDDNLGRITRLTLGPVDGYQPDPGEVRARKNHGGGSGATAYDSLISINKGAE